MCGACHSDAVSVKREKNDQSRVDITADRFTEHAEVRDDAEDRYWYYMAVLVGDDRINDHDLNKVSGHMTT